MNFWVKVIICLILGYAFGCFSTGYVVGKINHLDIRKYGSGNIGTTNALRTLGKKAAAVTLLGDVIKCIIPTLLIRFLIFPGDADIELLALITGVGAVLGHNYPFYMHFKGGKGIAAMSGAIIMFCVFNDWRIVPFELALFIVTVAISRYVSLGSLFISIAFPVWVAFDTGFDVPMILVSCIYTLSAFYSHRENIKRLLNGTERKIGEKVKTDNK